MPQSTAKKRPCLASPAIDQFSASRTPKQRRKVVASQHASLLSRKRKAATQAVPWFSKVPKLSAGLYDRFPHLLREASQNQDPEFQDPTASSSSAPLRQADPG